MRHRYGLPFLFAVCVFFAASLCAQNGVRGKPPLKSEVQRETPVDYLHNPPQDLPDFRAAGDQAPMAGVLAAVGENVSRLFANLFNISAVERIQQQKLDREGEADQGQKFEYLYLCFGAVDKTDPSFDEYRTDVKGHEVPLAGLNSGYMLTSGFVSAPLIFHPDHKAGSSFRLLGYQKLGGRDTIVIAFAQIPARSRISGSFQTGRNIEVTFKQGMVWIDAENYQIIRLVSDLLTPLHGVRLEKVETQIEFAEVQFDLKAHAFWLPVQVVVTVHWNGKVFRNTHAYSDFQRFNVETMEKVSKPSAGQPVGRSEGTDAPKKAP